MWGWLCAELRRDALKSSWVRSDRSCPVTLPDTGYPNHFRPGQEGVYFRLQGYEQPPGTCSVSMIKYLSGTKQLGFPAQTAMGSSHRSWLHPRQVPLSHSLRALCPACLLAVLWPCGFLIICKPLGSPTTRAPSTVNAEPTSDLSGLCRPWPRSQVDRPRIPLPSPTLQPLAPEQGRFSASLAWGH